MPEIAKEALKRWGYRVYLVPVLAVEWILFKCCYPYADYFSDSYSYIRAAVQRDLIGYRPIGYSIFLRMVHGIWASDTFLVTLQFVLVQGALLGLILWLRRWCGLPERLQRILFCSMVLNPLIPYLCNYVSSDALFIGVSLIWLTVLLELLRQPSWRGLLLQVVLLFVIFHLRYIALYYPAVAALTFLLARKAGFLFKLAGVAASIGVIVAGVWWVRQTTERETGAPVFSAFSGWQIANNALNMFPFIPMDTTGIPPGECRELGTDVGVYFERMGAESRARGPLATTDYMWVGGSPLHVYLDDFRNKTGLDYFVAWNRVAPVFSEYGHFLIRRHPLAYARYYVWPSTKSFFLTPLDVFAVYNEGNKTVDTVAKDWFHYPTAEPRVLSSTIQGRLLAPIPWIYLLLNVFFGLTTMLFLTSRDCRERHPVFAGCVRLAAAYLLANACFCILASPSVFRYQVLPMLLLFVFGISEIYCLTFRYGQFVEPSAARDRRS
ncbi:MAG TPA: hypothetical protein VNU70_02420 [Puia sp.]|jgi:hypothetical protein|nr:hypothetical protein [Puia sp.]